MSNVQYIKVLQTDINNQIKSVKTLVLKISKLFEIIKIISVINSKFKVM